MPSSKPAFVLATMSNSLVSCCRSADSLVQIIKSAVDVRIAAEMSLKVRLRSILASNAGNPPGKPHA